MMGRTEEVTRKKIRHSSSKCIISAISVALTCVLLYQYYYVDSWNDKNDYLLSQGHGQNKNINYL